MTTVLDKEVSSAIQGTALHLLNPGKLFHQEGNLTHEYIDVQPASGTIGFGNTVTLHLPKESGSNGENFLVMSAADPSSGNYTEALGLNVIESIEYRCGSEIVVPQINYEYVMNYCLNTMSSAKRERIISLSDNPAGGGNIIVPIWSPWSSLLNQGTFAPLNMKALSDYIVVKIKFRSGTACLAAGASGPGALTGQYWSQYYYSNVPATTNWVQKGISFRPGGSVALSAGADNRFNLTQLQGSHVAAIFPLCVSNADTTANLRYRLQSLDTMKLFVDSKLHEEFPNYAFSRYVQMIHRDYELNDSEILGGNSDDALFITFGKYSDRNNFGALVVNQGRHVDLVVNSPAAATVVAIGICHSTYAIVNGRLKLVDH